MLRGEGVFGRIWIGWVAETITITKTKTEMKRIFVIIVLCLGFIGCRGVKTITVEVPVPVHDTTAVVKEVHDSTYVDRWHTVYQKGDTVYDTKTITIMKTLTRTDTAYKVIERPITVTRTETVKVEKPMRWWQKGLMWTGCGLLVLIMGGAVWMLTTVKRDIIE